MGQQHILYQFALLEQMVRVWLSVGAGPGGNLEYEVAYKNQSSAGEYATEV